MVKNVLGGELKLCSSSPLTGWTRKGFCYTDLADKGTHIVCARMTDRFLNFTYTRGNDLITPSKNFPGLKAGDKWCLCVHRWIDAYNAGVAPPVDLEATHEKVREYIPLNILIKYRIIK
jgi:uncharacterized protein (DUF2237 family)